jgi:GPH family glycoside/pentoside/hexuronide:cation symporter
MYADTADYTEWKTGRRATAMTFAAASFAQKIGAALGMAGMLWVLAVLGYVAKEAQSGASQMGIVMLQTAIPGVFALIAAGVALCYKLKGETLAEIQEDLKRRSQQDEKG